MGNHRKSRSPDTSTENTKRVHFTSTTCDNPAEIQSDGDVRRFQTDFFLCFHHGNINTNMHLDRSKGNRVRLRRFPKQQLVSRHLLLPRQATPWSSEAQTLGTEGISICRRTLGANR